MRDAFARVLEEEMAQNERIVLITGDLGFGVLRQIHRRFPDRLIAVIDYNHMQSLATVDETLRLEPFEQKWKDFGDCNG